MVYYESVDDLIITNFTNTINQDPNRININTLLMQEISKPLRKVKYLFAILWVLF